MDNKIFAPGAGLVYMKVGTHAQETLIDIIARKKEELREAGEIFWGYGGPTCHPTLAVQPFAKEMLASGHAIYLAMKPMDSKHFAEPKLAEEYSDDGVLWKPVPKGIKVKGSRYALVLDTFEEADAELDLGAVHVGVGMSRGKLGSDYVKGRVDKGCFIVDKTRKDPDEPVLEHIQLLARLKKPYAVFLK